MPAIIIAMLLITGLAALSLAVVAVGMRGKFTRELPPAVSDRLTVVGAHLNGEAPAPTAFVDFYEARAERVGKLRRRG